MRECQRKTIWKRVVAILLCIVVLSGNGGIQCLADTVKNSEKSETKSELQSENDKASTAEINVEQSKQSDTIPSESAAIVYSGKDGDLDWSIDSEGCLRVSGVGDYEYRGYHDTMEVPEWCDNQYRLSVKSAIVNVSGIHSVGNMFCGCEELIAVNLDGLDTSKVTDMSSMFRRCKNLGTIDLSGFDTSNVTDMRWMFCGCGNLGTIDLSSFDTSNVTDMGGMFWECYNLGTIDVSNFDTSKVTNMGGMFYDCENLGIIDVSNFDTSNVTYMCHMFAYCDKLKNLDISNFDLSKVKDASYILEYSYSHTDSSAPSLETVTFPANLSTTIYLPKQEGHIWVDENRNLCTEAIIGLDKPMTYTSVDDIRWASAETQTVSISPDQTGIMVVDGETGEPLSDVNVQIELIEKATDEKGFATIASNSSGAYSILLTKEGYRQAETYFLIPKGTVKVIPMYSTKGKPKVLGVTAMIGQTETDLLQDKKCLIELEKASGTSKTMHITVGATGDVSKYQLIQNGKVIKESTKGYLHLVVTEGEGGKYYTEDLEAGYKVYVKVLGKNGEVSRLTEIGLTVSQASTLEWIDKMSESDEKGEISIGDKLKITVPSKIPLFGGSTFDIGMEGFLPVTVEADEDGKLKIAYNMDAEKTVDEFKKEYDNLKKKAKKGYLVANAFGKPASFGAGYANLKADVCGYGECYLADIKNNRFPVKVGIIITVESTTKVTQYWIPIYVTIELGADFQAEGNGTFVLENKRVTSNGLEITLKPSVWISPSVGVGVDGVLGAELSGKATLMTEMRLKNKYMKAVVEGKIEPVVYVGPWEKPLARLEGSYVIYETDQNSQAIAMETLSGGETMYSSDKYRIIPIDYLNNRTDERLIASVDDVGNVQEDDDTNVFKPEMVSEEAESVSENDIAPNMDTVSGNGIEVQTESVQMFEETEIINRSFVAQTAAEGITTVMESAFDNASPKLVHIGGEQYLFYLDGVSGRNSYDQSALFYTKSSDGIHWDMPVRVDAGRDETSDQYFDVAVSGKQIYIIWSNSDKEYTEEYIATNGEPTIESFLSDLDIMLAVLNTEDDTMLYKEMGTDRADMLPRVICDGNTVYTAWIQNSVSSQDGFFGTDNEASICFTKQSDALEESEIFTVPIEKNCFLLNFDLGILNGKVTGVVGVDTDGDLSTNDDKEIAYADLSMQDTNLSRLTDNDVDDSVPLFGELADVSCLYWYQNGNICYTTDGIRIDKIFDENDLPGIGKNFQVFDNGAGMSQIVWSAISKEENVDNAVVYAASYIDGAWQQAYTLAQVNSEYTISPDGYLKGDTPIFTYVSRNYDASTSRNKSDICIMQPNAVIDTTAKCEVAEENLTLGENLKIQAVVTNTGNQTVDTLVVTIPATADTEAFYTELQDMNLLAGQSREITIEGPALPDMMNGLYQNTITIAADVESKTSDNQAKLSFGQADLCAKVDTSMINGDNIATITVQNTGLLTTDAKLILYKDAELTQKAYETIVEDVANTDWKTIAINLSMVDIKTNAFYLVLEDCNTDETLKEIYTSDNRELITLGFGAEKEYGTSEETPSDSGQESGKDDRPSGDENKGNGSAPANEENTNKVMKVSSIQITAPSKKLAAGKKVQFAAEIAPANADNQSVTWSSSNKKYATVDANGKVTFKKAGAGKSVVITATANDGSGVSASYKIKIMKDSVKKVKLSAASKSIKAGKSVKIKAVITTTGKQANKTLKWTSSNEEYATVNSKGKVKTKKAGKGKTVTITATTTDGSGKKAKIKLKLK